MAEVNIQMTQTEADVIGKALRAYWESAGRPLHDNVFLLTFMFNGFTEDEARQLDEERQNTS